MILYGSKSNGLEGDIFLTIIALLVSMFVLISLITASRMEKTLNQTGINVLTKVSGLLIAAIAVQLVFSGLQQMIPSLNNP